MLKTLPRVKNPLTLRREHLTLLITIIMLQMRIYGDQICGSQNCFSENELFKHQLAEILKLIPLTANFSVLCTMLIAILFGLSHERQIISLHALAACRDF